MLHVKSRPVWFDFLQIFESSDNIDFVSVVNQRRSVQGFVLSSSGQLLCVLYLDHVELEKLCYSKDSCVSFPCVTWWSLESWRWLWTPPSCRYFIGQLKRFATLAIPMSFRCHGDVIIDVGLSRLFSVILGAKQVVHTRYSPLATSTLRI